jgi:hypothetical protein
MNRADFLKKLGLGFCLVPIIANLPLLPALPANDGVLTDSGPVSLPEQRTREPFLLIMCGSCGTGKTFATKKLIKREDPFTEREIVVVDPHGEYTKEDVCMYKKWQIISSLDKYKANMASGPQLLIVDGQIPWRADLIMRSLVICRTRQIDIVLHYQSFSAIPTAVFQMANYMRVFKTHDYPTELKFEDKRFKLIEAAKYVSLGNRSTMVHL